MELLAETLQNVEKELASLRVTLESNAGESTESGLGPIVNSESGLGLKSPESMAVLPFGLRLSRESSEGKIIVEGKVTMEGKTTILNEPKMLGSSPEVLYNFPVSNFLDKTESSSQTPRVETRTKTW